MNGPILISSIYTYIEETRTGLHHGNMDHDVDITNSSCMRSATAKVSDEFPPTKKTIFSCKFRRN